MFAAHAGLVYDVTDTDFQTSIFNKQSKKSSESCCVYITFIEISFKEPRMLLQLDSAVVDGMVIIRNVVFWQQVTHGRLHTNVIETTAGLKENVLLAVNSQQSEFVVWWPFTCSWGRVNAVGCNTVRTRHKAKWRNKSLAVGKDVFCFTLPHRTF